MVTTQPKAPAPYLRHPTADKAREVSVEVGMSAVFIGNIERGTPTAIVAVWDDADAMALARGANSLDTTALGALADWLDEHPKAVRQIAGFVLDGPTVVGVALRSACEHALYRDDLEAGADRPERL